MSAPLAGVEKREYCDQCKASATFSILKDNALRCMTCGHEKPPKIRGGHDWAEDGVKEADYQTNWDQSE